MKFSIPCWQPGQATAPAPNPALPEALSAPGSSRNSRFPGQPLFLPGAVGFAHGSPRGAACGGVGDGVRKSRTLSTAEPFFLKMCTLEREGEWEIQFNQFNSGIDRDI